MPSSTPIRRVAFLTVVILLSGVIWLISWKVAQTLLDFTQVKQGITLVYVPAGVRLVILLIAGFWGAVGLALVYPLVLIQSTTAISWPEIAVQSVIAGFVPYLAVLAVCRSAGVSRDLGRLRSIHLPLLAAAVSIAGALALTLARIAFGRFSPASFLPDFTGTAMGDFLGCFAVILLVRFAISRGKTPK